MLVDKQSELLNERSFVYHPPAWRRWRNVKTTYSVSLRNGDVQSRAAIISHQDSGRQIKRVLPGPVNHSGYNSCQID